MSERSEQTSRDISEVPLAERDLAALVPEWLEWSQVAELLGVTPSKVRTSPTTVSRERLRSPMAPSAGKDTTATPCRGLACPTTGRR